MNCTEFLDWLDAGAGTTAQSAAYAHTARCGNCAQRLATAHRVDEILSAPLPPARPGLAAQVMERVRESGAPAPQPPAAGIAPARLAWRQFVAEPAILFPCIAACMTLLFALFAALPGTAARVRPGLGAFRQLSVDGAQTLSAMTSAPAGMPLLLLLACAAVAGAAWFATRGPRLRTR